MNDMNSLHELHLEQFRKTGIDLDLANPRANYHELFADLRYLGNSAYPRLKAGEQWGDWTLDDVYTYFAKIVDTLRSECYFPLIPPQENDPQYSSSYWELYREVEKQGLLKTTPPNADKAKQWEEKRKELLEAVTKALKLPEDWSYDIFLGNKEYIIFDSPDIPVGSYLLVDNSGCYGIIKIKQYQKITKASAWKKIRIPALMSDSQLYAFFRIRVDYTNNSLSAPIFVYSFTFTPYDQPKAINIVNKEKLILDVSEIEFLDQEWKEPQFLYRDAESASFDLVNKLKELDYFVYIPDFIELTGSSVFVNNRKPRDLDLILRAEYNHKENMWYLPLNTSFFLKLNRSVYWATKQLSGKGIEPDYPPPNPQGANFPSIPIADLVVKFKKPKLKEPDEPQWAKLIYPIDFKESDDDSSIFFPRETRLRVKQDTEKMAQQSLEEDKIEMFRFYYPCKPVRPPKNTEERQTPENLAELFSEEDYKNGLFVSEKRDGNHVIVMKENDKVKIYSEDGSDNTSQFPLCIEAIKNEIKADSIILEAEAEAWDNGQHLPREAMAGLMHSKDVKDYNVILNFFDCLYHNGEDLHKQPYAERWNILTSLGLASKNGALNEKEMKLNVIPHKIVKSRSELLEVTNKLRNLKGSEGVVVCKSTFKYPLRGFPYDNDMAKFHNNVVIKAVVLEAIETKVSGVFNLRYGILPGSYSPLYSDIEEAGGYELIEVGKTFASPYVKRGLVIEIEAETINLIYREDKSEDVRTSMNKSTTPVQISAWSPRFMKVSSGEPDTIDSLLAKAKKENHVLQYKKVFKDHVEYFEESYLLNDEIESQTRFIVFYTNGTTLDSRIVPKNEAFHKIILDTTTYHYYVDEFEFLNDFIEIDSEYSTPLEYIRKHGLQLKEVADPYSLTLDESKTHKFIWEYHWRVGLKDLLKETNLSQLWPETEPTPEEWENMWDEYWPKVKKELQNYFDNHPNFSFSPSVHVDFRYELDENALAGWTIMAQIADKPKLPPLDMEQATAFAKDSENWKVDVVNGEIPKRVKKGGAVSPVSLVSTKKGGYIPPEWSKVEGIFPPRSIPSTRYGYSILHILRKGIVETGYMTSYAKEYFLNFTEPKHMSSFRWRVMFRYLHKPFAESNWEEDLPELQEAERIIPVSPEGFGKEEVGWLMIFTVDPVPYYLSSRAVKLKHFPPHGYSGLPKYIRSQIPEKYQYWKIKDDEERRKLRDELVEAISKGEVNLKESIIKDFALKFHYSDPEEAIKRKAPAHKHYDIYIPISENNFLHLVTEYNPLDSTSTPVYIKPCTGKEGGIDWFNVGKEKVEKFESGPGSFGKQEAGYVTELDRGRVQILEDSELFKKFKFNGKKLKGIWIMNRSDTQTEIWNFEKSEELKSE